MKTPVGEFPRLAASYRGVHLCAGTIFVRKNEHPCAHTRKSIQFMDKNYACFRPTRRTSKPAKPLKYKGKYKMSAPWRGEHFVSNNVLCFGRGDRICSFALVHLALRATLHCGGGTRGGHLHLPPAAAAAFQILLNITKSNAPLYKRGITFGLNGDTASLGKRAQQKDLSAIKSSIYYS